MDPHRLNCPAAADADTADTEDWDNDDFVIPSLSVEESDQGDWEVSQASAPQPPPKQEPTKDTENIYLGPHWAAPSRGKKQEEALATSGYHDKNIKVKEADRKVSGTGRDNKVGFSRDFHRYNNAGHHVK
ncbi:uncharacterized protein [Lolium perenne]|uniref:uncharacterized protein n=1 Tax=Lolium perenne TaxID=4522 RepID=UPI0021F5E08E|nr:uncharacterized protein LOC127332471 [Lolium perenne]